MIVPPALPSGGYAEQLEQTSGDFLRLLLETANMRVPRVIHITRYNLFSLTRASAVVNCWGSGSNAVGGNESLAGWNFCPNSEPSVAPPGRPDAALANLPRGDAEPERLALCAAEPGAGSAWAEPPAEAVTSAVCLVRLERLRASAQAA